VIKRSFRFGLRLGLLAGLGYAAAKVRKLWQAPAGEAGSDGGTASWPKPAPPPPVNTPAGPSPAAPQPPPGQSFTPGTARTADTTPSAAGLPAETPAKKVAPRKTAPKKTAAKKTAPVKKSAATEKAAGKKAIPPKKSPPKPPKAF